MQDLQMLQTRTTTTTPQQPQTPPAIIAIRKSCDANGIGLSHYILMDRKPAQ